MDEIEKILRDFNPMTDYEDIANVKEKLYKAINDEIERKSVSVVRDAITGRIVSVEEAARNPDTTILQKVTKKF